MSSPKPVAMASNDDVLLDIAVARAQDEVWEQELAMAASRPPPPFDPHLADLVVAASAAPQAPLLSPLAPEHPFVVRSELLALQALCGKAFHFGCMCYFGCHCCGTGLLQCTASFY
jgi:hypothetical protein